MAARSSRPEVLTGLFILIGLACLGGLILQFGRFSRGGSGTYEVSVTFEDSAGLVKGSDVRMGGTRVGIVTSDPALNDELLSQVSMSIRSDVKIAEGSEVAISSVGLLGDKMIKITPPEAGFTNFVSPGSALTGTPSAGIETLQEDVGQVMKNAISALESFDKTATKMDSTLDQVNATLSTLQTGLLSEKNGQNFQSTMANLSVFSQDLSQAGKELEPAISDLRTTLASFRRTAATADDTFATANDQLQSLQPAIEEIPPAIQALADTSRKASKALDKLDNEGSLLKTLTEDETLATDTKEFVRNLKRYGVLRYRDDPTTPAPDPRDRFRGSRR